MDLIILRRIENIFKYTLGVLFMVCVIFKQEIEPFIIPVVEIALKYKYVFAYFILLTMFLNILNLYLVVVETLRKKRK